MYNKEICYIIASIQYWTQIQSATETRWIYQQLSKTFGEIVYWRDPKSVAGYMGSGNKSVAIFPLVGKYNDFDIKIKLSRGLESVVGILRYDDFSKLQASGLNNFSINHSSLLKNTAYSTNGVDNTNIKYPNIKTPFFKVTDPNNAKNIRIDKQIAIPIRIKTSELDVRNA